jgi:hypothetical protein
MARYLQLIFVSVLLWASSGIATANQVVWVSPKKGACVADVGKAVGIEKGETICLFKKSNKAYYCVAIKAVSDDKSIFHLSKDVREHVEIGDSVSIYPVGATLPSVVALGAASVAPPKRVPSTQVVQKTKKKLRKKKRRKKRKRKDIKPEESAWDLFLDRLEDVTIFGAEARYFPKDSLADGPENSAFSVSIQTEWEYTTESADDTFRLNLFGRRDSVDENRTHTDVREAEWVTISEKAELRMGVRKVFWGITESQHLVDIVNQTDQVEDLEGDQKLGQPMINFAWIDDWGTLDLYILPLFRERTLPGEDGRFGFGMPIESATYESDEEKHHVDWAGRYSKSFDSLDLGLSWFIGTSREPEFNVTGDVVIDPLAGPTFVPTGITPYYRQIAQVGLELQYFVDAFLFKVEAINRNQSTGAYQAHTSGLEYTFSSIWDSGIDTGFITEYSFDVRRSEGGMLENDVFLGMRVTGNDENSTEVLAGIFVDALTQSRAHSVEFKRRFDDSLIIKLKSRGFFSDDEDDGLYSIRNEGYSQIELSYYL